MKKLTKRQREIESLAGRLPKPSATFHKWDKWLRELNDFKDTDEVWESYYSNIGNYIVERTFQVGKEYCNEVAQWWCDTATGSVFYRERKSSLIYGGNYGYRFHGYDAKTDFTFKSKSGMVDQYGYRFCTPYSRGRARVTELLKMKGATDEDLHKHGVERVSKALADSRMETILKHNKKDFEWFLTSGREMTDAVFSAYKITIRKKFSIRNISLWYDTITEMEYIGMDVHNPRYVCSRTYKKFHDEVYKKAEKKREIERKILAEKRRKEEMERNKALVEERTKKFGDLVIDNGRFHSVVLITYDDYKEEGARMHHCVGGYFNRGGSLIISMRDADGKRVESVEINLTNFNIVQSRGLQNQVSAHHEEIVNLVTENMWQIRERQTGVREVRAA